MPLRRGTTKRGTMIGDPGTSTVPGVTVWTRLPPQVVPRLLLVQGLTQKRPRQQKYPRESRKEPASAVARQAWLAFQMQNLRCPLLRGRTTVPLNKMLTCVECGITTYWLVPSPGIGTKSRAASRTFRLPGRRSSPTNGPERAEIHEREAPMEGHRSIGRIGAGENAITPATGMREATRNATAPPSECPARIVRSGRVARARSAREPGSRQHVPARHKKSARRPPVSRQIWHKNAQPLRANPAVM